MDEIILDEIDKSILELLVEDSKIPYAEIARKLDLSRAVVTNRVNAMIAKEVIKKFAAIVDPQKLGKDITVLFEIETLPSKTQEIIGILIKNKDIGKVLKTSSYALFAYAFFTDSNHLNNFVTNFISKIEGVQGIKPNFILESYSGESVFITDTITK